MKRSDYPAKQNEFDKTATPMKYNNTMDPRYRDAGAKTKVRPEKVQIRDSKTGKLYGTRTLVQKSTESVNKPLTLKQFMLAEFAGDMTALPDKVVDEIKKNIRDGAKDLEQNWANALELTHKAYEVTNVARPTPEQQGAWKQYDTLIAYAVKQLAFFRGLNGAWRMSKVLYAESLEEGSRLKSHRFFIDIPGHEPREVDASNMDEIIESLTNKLRRQGLKVRVVERTDKTTTLSVIDKEDNEHERIVIRDIS